MALFDPLDVRTRQQARPDLLFQAPSRTALFAQALGALPKRIDELQRLNQERIQREASIDLLRAKAAALRRPPTPPTPPKPKVPTPKSPEQLRGEAARLTESQLRTEFPFATPQQIPEINKRRNQLRKENLELLQKGIQTEAQGPGKRKFLVQTQDGGTGVLFEDSEMPEGATILREIP